MASRSSTPGISRFREDFDALFEQISVSPLDTFAMRHFKETSERTETPELLTPVTLSSNGGASQTSPATSSSHLTKQNTDSSATTDQDDSDESDKETTYLKVASLDDFVPPRAPFMKKRKHNLLPPRVQPTALTNASRPFTAAHCTSPLSRSDRPEKPVDLGQYDGHLVFIAGPSGSGRKQLMNMLSVRPNLGGSEKTPGCWWPFKRQKNEPKPLGHVIKRAITTTDRERRIGERADRDYHFVSPQKLNYEIRCRNFVEGAVCDDSKYMTTKDSVRVQDGAGHIILININRDAMRRIRSDMSKMADTSKFKARFVFIEPPDFMCLEAALRGQGDITEYGVQRRLRDARDEVAFANTGAYDRVFVNRDRMTTYNELRRYIFHG